MEAAQARGGTAGQLSRAMLWRWGFVRGAPRACTAGRRRGLGAAAGLRDCRRGGEIND